MILVVGLLCAGLSLTLIAASLARSLGRRGQAVSERLERVVGRADEPSSTTAAVSGQNPFRRRAWDRRLVRSALGRSLEQELLQAGLKWRVSEYVAFSLAGSAFGFLFGTVIIGNLIVGVLAAFVVLLVPKLYISQRRRSRLKALNGQLIPLLDALVAALRAGYSLLQGLESARTELQPPMSEEIAHVLREIGLGVSVEESLQNLVQRTGDPDLEMLVTAVLIQRRVGGNLTEVLGNISHTMRERIRIRGEIRTLTAQGRLSGIIVALMPLVLMAALRLLSPGYVDPLFETELGRLLLLACVISDAIGFFVINKIVDIKV